MTDRWSNAPGSNPQALTILLANPRAARTRATCGTAARSGRDVLVCDNE
jgi:hypothetical protein